MSAKEKPSRRRSRARRRSRRIVLLVAAAVAAALVAHLWFWYAPRERTLSPDLSDLPGRILVDGDASFRLWLAYPHQTLGAFARSRPDLAELWRSSVPPFAVFPAPPARELAIAGDAEGGAAAARVFPTAAIVAKAAGRLAGNPWLRGGAVRIGGAEGTVAWRGSLWTLLWGEAQLPHSPDDERRPVGDSAISAAPRSALTWLEPRELGFDVPARGGWWDVRPSPEGLRLTRLDASEAPGIVGSPLVDDALRLVKAAPEELGFFAVRDAGSFVEALFVLDPPQEPGILRFPSATLASAGSEALRRELELPARELFDALGAGFREEEVGSWSLLATDRRSVDLARPTLESLDPRVGGGGDPRTGVRPETWLVALRPRAVHRLARAVDDVLEKLPVGGRDVRERWRRYREWSGALLAVDWIALSMAPDRIEVHAPAAGQGAASDSSRR